MYTDRAVFSPVLGVIGEEFRVSPVRLGLLGSVFYFAYAAFQIPVGFVAHSIGRRRLLIWGFALFGVTTFLSGLAGSFFILIILSALTGLGQATYYPIQYSIAAQRVPKEHRTLALALINVGMAVGVGGGTLFAAYVSFELGLGWRVSLVGMGLLTVLVAFVLGRVVGDLREDPVSEGSPQYSIKDVLRKDQVAAYLAGFCSLYGFFALITWLPYYLERFQGFDEFGAGALSTVAAWASIPGALIAARISDSFGSQRRLVLWMFPVAAAAIGSVPFVTAPWTLVILVVYGGFGKLATDPLLVTYLAERSDPTVYPLTFGVFNFSGMLGSVVAPTATGVIVQLTGDMTLAFLVASVLMLVGALMLWLLGSEAGPSAPTYVTAYEIPNDAATRR